MLPALMLVLLVVPPAAQSAQPPRDPAVRPGIVADSAAREEQLSAQIAARPDGAAYLQLARLQQQRGALDEAEATLVKGHQALPKNKPVAQALVQLYMRRGQFDKTVAMLQQIEQLDPTDPQAPQMTATFYWDKASRDKALLPAEQYAYVIEGIAATDRALALNSDYVDALTYKNLLLRQRAGLESDATLKQQLIAEADVLRNRAIELGKGRIAISGRGGTVAFPPPPPPPGAPAAQGSSAPGDAPVRVGGNIKAPEKIRNVPPVYPADAQAAGIQGVVIIEATIDRGGRVQNAKVLRSIPMLDQAAVEAVTQWEFTPTLLEGVPVPVIMTVTVNFTLQ